jgi:Ca2+-binding EF-hand superfamily protein
MKTHLIAGLAVAAIALPVLASAQIPSATPPAHHSAPGKSMTRADVGQKVQQHFARLDTDRDGFITKAEADAAKQSWSEKRHQRMEHRGSAMFDRFDTNKDGVVTRAEAEPFFASRQVDIAHVEPGDSKPRRNWDALISRHDANKDGAISRAEFEAGRAQHAQKMVQRRPEAAMHHVGLGRLFERADSNNDGRVSLAEANAAALAHFDAADTDRDGIVSRSEMRQARKAMATEDGRR